MHLPLLALFLTSTSLTMATQNAAHAPPAFSLNPYNEYDEHYTTAVRTNLAKFHENLTKGNYTANGPLNALDSHWNYDGVLILGREGFIKALTGFVDTAIRGVDARDVYRIVDGHKAATLYRLQGTMSGNFLDVEYRDGAKFHAYGTEMWEFDEEALLRTLITVDQIGIIRNQLNGTVGVPEFTPHDPPIENPQTPPGYRALIHQTVAQFYKNINEGKGDANAAFATEDVVVDENSVVVSGQDAFVQLLDGSNAGFEEFVGKVFHADYVLADGHVGVVEYVWQGSRLNETGSVARQRGMIYFEFNDDGLVTKATGVYDEHSITRQLEGTGGFLYP